MKKLIHFRDHGYGEAKIYKSQERPCVLSYRPLCSLRWLNKEQVTHRWNKVTCTKCLKKRGRR